ncbi:helix-turn-helix domain-containing protein [Streptomyces olivaceus]|uniref:helix-turn-helix domain-containing protein n=1 Tax=Streptomyces olivaceus TaxID=47716 RepID=UPI001CCAF5BA|nr:helix-turn-helix transcriptional regulator [Streptomyces olivaceus]MBZ6226109.1 helix-turn-helix domain-containing protein [Streptomyces olivaceus]
MTSVRDEEAGRGQAAVPVQGGRRAGDEPGSGVVTAFGRQLKLLRIRAGLERTEFGKRMGYSADTVASIEQGRRIPQPGFIEKADEVLEAGGVLTALKEEVARAQYPAYFRDMARLEASALGLHVYAAHAVPGLLQTEDYARAVFQMQRPLLDDEVIEQRLAARLMRQDIFARRPAPLLSFVIEEVVLRKPIGGRGPLRGQWEQILLVGRHRNVEIQVMPTDREDHAGLGGPFTLIDNAEGRRLAYTEVQDDSRLYADSAKVRELEARYGILRSQALTPCESLAFVEELLGEK